MIELTDSPCQSSQGLYASGPATCRSKIRIPRCFTKQRTRIFSGGILRLHSVHASSCRLSFAHSQSSLSPCPLMCIKTSTLSMSTPNSAIHADLAQEARKAGDLERWAQVPPQLAHPSNQTIQAQGRVLHWRQLLVCGHGIAISATPLTAPRYWVAQPI